MSGLGSPGVNVENYTAVWGDPPSYVGLRTDWKWVVQISLNWKKPILMDSANEWAAIGIAASQYVQGAPGDLVYTIINLWTDSNSSKNVSPLAGRVGRGVTSPDTVVYHPLQISSEGNQTVTINISPYLADTIRLLGLPAIQNRSPVIPYVYLNVEGYNFLWNSTLWSFKLMTRGTASTSAILFALVGGGLVAVLVTILFSWVMIRRSRRFSERKASGSGSPQPENG